MVWPFSPRRRRVVRNVFSCPKRWEDMPGDDLVRTCQACSRRVYDLRGLDVEEATQFLEAHDGEVCALAHVDRSGYLVDGACGRANAGGRLGSIALLTGVEAVRVKERSAELRLASLRRLVAALEERARRDAAGG